MSEGRIYLTVDRKKRQPENDGYIAILSRGHIQFHDQNVEVLSVEVVPNMKAAQAWRKRMMRERPWETRQ